MIAILNAQFIASIQNMLSNLEKRFCGIESIPVYYTVVVDTVSRLATTVEFYSLGTHTANVIVFLSMGPVL